MRSRIPKIQKVTEKVLVKRINSRIAATGYHITNVHPVIRLTPVLTSRPANRWGLAGAPDGYGLTEEEWAEVERQRVEEKKLWAEEQARKRQALEDLGRELGVVKPNEFLEEGRG